MLSEKEFHIRNPYFIGFPMNWYGQMLWSSCPVNSCSSIVTLVRWWLMFCNANFLLWSIGGMIIQKNLQVITSNFLWLYYIYVVYSLSQIHLSLTLQTIHNSQIMLLLYSAAVLSWTCIFSTGIFFFINTNEYWIQNTQNY